MPAGTVAGTTVDPLPLCCPSAVNGLASNWARCRSIGRGSWDRTGLDRTEMSQLDQRRPRIGLTANERRQRHDDLSHQHRSRPRLPPSGEHHRSPSGPRRPQAAEPPADHYRAAPPHARRRTRHHPRPLGSRLLDIARHFPTAEPSLRRVPNELQTPPIARRVDQTSRRRDSGQGRVQSSRTTSRGPGDLADRNQLDARRRTVASQGWQLPSSAEFLASRLRPSPKPSSSNGSPSGRVP